MTESQLDERTRWRPSVSDKVECCYLGGDGQSCPAEAEWLIIASDEVREPTYACTAHVGYLLFDAPFHTVTWIGKSSTEVEHARTV